MDVAVPLPWKTSDSDGGPELLPHMLLIGVRSRGFQCAFPTSEVRHVHELHSMHEHLTGAYGVSGDRGTQRTQSRKEHRTCV